MGVIAKFSYSCLDLFAFSGLVWCCAGSVLDEKGSLRHSFAAVQPKNSLMITVVRKWCWLASLMVFAAVAGYAQVPSGQVVLNFDNSSSPVIDLTGDFSPTNQVLIGAGGQQVPISFSGVLINVKPNGKITGQSSATVTVSGSPVAVDYLVSGKMSGGGTRAIKANFTLNARGNGTVSGQPTKLSLVITYNLTYNPADVSLEGTSRGSLSMSASGKSKINSPVGVELPSASDGSWSALLDIIPTKQIGGSGQVQIRPFGQLLGGNLSGSFSAGQNLSKIKLKGTGDSRGFNAKFNLGVNAEGAPELETMKGKILGQTVLQ
jgi:hypothetical protein